ncbi:MAG: MucR family transcriptional regulator [Desulfovibrio sp.]|nr:MucR family transcriptional regulator [Desulfovibrio sp.]
MQNDEAFAQAMAITSAQAGVRAMTAQEVVAYAQEVAAGIRQLQGDASCASAGATEPAVNPKDAVRETYVVCLECGAKFKMLTKRHLAEHGLTPAEYKAKWSLKKSASLACKSLQRMRRQKMQDRQLWTRRKGLEPKAGAE